MMKMRHHVRKIMRRDTLSRRKILEERTRLMKKGEVSHGEIMHVCKEKRKLIVLFS